MVTNWTDEHIYIGITNDLERRLSEHKQRLVQGHTQKYNLNKLVYYENYSDVNEAIARERQLKNWRREKKNFLVETLNPEWRDLSDGWFKDPSTSLGMTVNRVS